MFFELFDDFFFFGNLVFETLGKCSKNMLIFADFKFPTYGVFDVHFNNKKNENVKFLHPIWILTYGDFDIIFNKNFFPIHWDFIHMWISTLFSANNGQWKLSIFVTYVVVRRKSSQDDFLADTKHALFVTSCSKKTLLWTFHPYMGDFQHRLLLKFSLFFTKKVSFESKIGNFRSFSRLIIVFWL